MHIKCLISRLANEVLYQNKNEQAHQAKRKKNTHSLHFLLLQYANFESTKQN